MGLMAKVIKEIAIQPATSPLGDTAAWAVFEDQKTGSVSEGHLFVWNNDEIHFDSCELLGLTILEAHELRNQKHRQNREARESEIRKIHHLR